MLLKRAFRENSRWDLFWILITTPLVVPTLRNITQGQMNLLIATLWLTSYLLYERDRKVLPSLLLALAAMIKIYPALMVLVLLRNRRYREVLYVIGFCILIALISMIFMGPGIWLDYMHFSFGSVQDVSGYTGVKPLLGAIYKPLAGFWLIVPLAYILISVLFAGKPLKKGWATMSIAVIISSPLVWAAHFLPSYFFVLYCLNRIQNQWLKALYFLIFTFSIARYSTLPIYFWRVPALLVFVLIGWLFVIIPEKREALTQ